MIKIIATDMDGTLLNSRGSISEENYKAIQLALKAGIDVVIATGRSQEFARFPVEEKGLRLPYIVMNGALIINKDGDIESSIPLDKALIHEVVQILNEYGVYYEFYTNQGHISVSKKKGISILKKVLQHREEWKSLGEILEYIYNRFKNSQMRFIQYSDDLIKNEDLEIYKMIVFSFEKDKLCELQEILSQNPQLAISSSGYGNLEINHVEARKGLALERYARKRNISIAETMAIGDSLNDADMLKRAGFSVAMNNASEDIKQLADYVTLSNDQDGFAHAVYKVIEMNQNKKSSLGSV